MKKDCFFCLAGSGGESIYGGKFPGIHHLSCLFFFWLQLILMLLVGSV